MEARSVTPYGGGAGGKFRKPPTRKPSSTPYDRPAINQSVQQRGWLSKLVNPAYRLISGGATRIMPSLFNKSGSVSDIPISDTSDHGNNSTEEVPNTEFDDYQAPYPGNYRSSEEAGPSNAVDLLGTNPSRHEREQDKKKPSDDSELSKIEQIMKGKLFSRDEINRLTEILNSKIVSDAEPEKEKPKLNAEGEAKINTLVLEYHATPIENEKDVDYNVPRIASPHAESNIQNKVIASPIDIAKAYMGGRTSDLGPSSYSTMSKSERMLYKGDDAQTNLSIPPPSPKPSTCWPGAMVQDQHVYSTPLSQRGSFGFQNLPRTPYSRTIYPKSKSKLTQLQADNRCLKVSSSPFQQSRTPIFGQVKSRTNLDSGYGSGGAIHRIRNKFASETPGRGSASLFPLHKGPSQVKESNASKVFFPKEKNMELVGTSGTADNHPVESVAYGSGEGLPTPTLQSSAAAREILEELANKPTPNDLATELKNSSPWKNFSSRDSDIMQNEHNSSIHSRGSVDLRKNTNDLKVSAEGSDNGENLMNREKSQENDALNIIAKKSSTINGEFDVMSFTSGEPSVGINKVSEFQMRSTRENAFVDANKRQHQGTKFYPIDNHVNGQDVVKRTTKTTGSELLKKQPTHFSGTKRTLKSISVNKQGVPGFTFPVSASGTLSEPPTPSIVPSFSSGGMPQRTEEPALPSYTFGAKGSYPRLDFSSFPSTSKSSTPNDASDMKFNFGSDKKTRISFKLVGEGANCY